MPNKITIDLIRRKAEHNEGLIHTLEELSLHQEELETIDDTLGCNCRRLKILYLQNNIIGEMKNLHHMKELQYLNLALNNISKVEGLKSCEFLNKLDLTVNFVDMDELESSITAMEGNRHLADLYMMGNPCQAWAGFEAYVIARLPQLERLDGKEITRTDRIKAQQRLPALVEEITPLADEVRRRKRNEKRTTGHGDGDESHQDDRTKDGRKEAEGDVGSGHHPPAPAKSDEVRTAIYREMAEQKKEKEDRQRENLPRDRNFDAEQVSKWPGWRGGMARQRESEGTIRQCNEGKLEFRFEETHSAAFSSLAGGGGSRRSGDGGDIVLEVGVPKHLDSSLIDVDVLRLSLQAEVRAGEAKARRSKTTGSLVITMPKVNPDQSIGLVPSDGRRRTPGVVADRAAASKSAATNDVGRTKRRTARAPTLAALMMEEAQAAAAASKKGGDDEGNDGEAEPPQQAVSIRGLVGPRHGGLDVESTPDVVEVASSVKRLGATSISNRVHTTTPPPADTLASTAVPTGLPTPPTRYEGKAHGQACPPQPKIAVAPPAPPTGDSVALARAGGQEGAEGAPARGGS
ncbi:unnamed protein product [Scytosiphon promiscuus]